MRRAATFKKKVQPETPLQNDPASFEKKEENSEAFFKKKVFPIETGENEVYTFTTAVSYLQGKS